MNFKRYEICLSEYNSDVVLFLPDVLSEQERCILHFLLCGMNVTLIAKNQNKSVKTISTQKASIYKKLKIKKDITFWQDLYFKYDLKIIRRIR